MVHPLTPFAHWDWPAPYRFESTSLGRTATVFPVRSKTGLVAARRGELAHLDDGVAALHEGGHVQFAARFLCAEGSKDVAVLADARTHGGVCEKCVDAAAGPCVYRCYSAAASLIYIGSTERWLRRLGTHQSQTPWWPEVVDGQRTHYRSIFEARAVETTAIDAEKPLYNKPRSARGGRRKKKSIPVRGAA